MKEIIMAGGPLAEPPAPSPGEEGMMFNPIELVTAVLDCYKDVEVTREVEQTKRVIARERARIAIAAFEAHTEEYLMTLKSHHEMQMELIKIIGDLAQKPNLDENTLQLCGMILKNLHDNQETQTSKIGTFTINR